MAEKRNVRRRCNELLIQTAKTLIRRNWKRKRKWKPKEKITTTSKIIQTRTTPTSVPRIWKNAQENTTKTKHKNIQKVSNLFYTFILSIIEIL